MLRRKVFALFAVMGAAAVSACAPQTVYVPQPVAVQQVPVVRGCDTRFQVVNRSSVTMMTLQFSHASLSGWGPDQLGRNVLPPGRAMTYRAANTGAYDFRATFANGRSAELRRVDVCRARRIVATNSGLFAQ